MIDPVKYPSDFRHRHIVIDGEWAICAKEALNAALIVHTPEYNLDKSKRTRITLIASDAADIHDFVFEYQELFDNSYWRIVDLRSDKPSIELHRPQYEGMREDFVDVEWEFVLGRLSNPLLQTKLRRWSADEGQRLVVVLCYSDKAKNESFAEKLKRRLPGNADVITHDAFEQNSEDLMAMAKYLHYFYQASYELQHVPTELPEEDVDRAWNAISDERMKMSNLYNVMSIPFKMQILGHDRSDWDNFYALTSDEIEQLTEVEHNRWCVERLIQGTRPCTDDERREVAEDLRLRLADSRYAQENPMSLKKKYKTERNAHYDMCAYSELGADETGLPVTRYDRDLTAAIPLIVKTFNDRRP